MQELVWPTYKKSKVEAQRLETSWSQMLQRLSTTHSTHASFGKWNGRDLETPTPSRTTAIHSMRGYP